MDLMGGHLVGMIFTKRNGFLLVGKWGKARWGCSSHYVVYDLLYLEGDLDANKYIKVLYDVLLSLPTINHG